jgi:hypothetical protein
MKKTRSQKSRDTVPLRRSVDSHLESVTVLECRTCDESNWKVRKAYTLHRSCSQQCGQELPLPSEIKRRWVRKDSKLIYEFSCRKTRSAVGQLSCLVVAQIHTCSYCTVYVTNGNALKNLPLSFISIYEEYSVC